MQDSSELWKSLYRSNPRSLGTHTNQFLRDAQRLYLDLPTMQHVQLWLALQLKFGRNSCAVGRSRIFLDTLLEGADMDSTTHGTSADQVLDHIHLSLGLLFLKAFPEIPHQLGDRQASRGIPE